MRVLLIVEWLIHQPLEFISQISVGEGVRMVDICASSDAETDSTIEKFHPFQMVFFPILHETSQAILPTSCVYFFWTNF